jgi:hypothetical protein
MTAARTRSDDYGLSLLDPIVQGAGKAIVERHRRRGARRERQASGGRPEQKSAHQSAAIDRIHFTAPPSIEPERSGSGRLSQAYAILTAITIFQRGTRVWNVARRRPWPLKVSRRWDSRPSGAAARTAKRKIGS